MAVPSDPGTDEADPGAHGAGPGPPGVGEGARRRMALLLVSAAAVVVAYWALWFGHRSLVASGTGAGYVQFEDAFPVADAWLVVCLVLGALTLVTRRPSSLLFMVAGAGAGLYLFALDVLYDLQHGIWAKGANGLTEFAINVVTLVLSLAVLRWAWRRRAALLSGR